MDIFLNLLSHLSLSPVVAALSSSKESTLLPNRNDERKSESTRQRGVGPKDSLPRDDGTCRAWHNGFEKNDE